MSEAGSSFRACAFLALVVPACGGRVDGTASPLHSAPLSGGGLSGSSSSGGGSSSGGSSGGSSSGSGSGAAGSSSGGGGSTSASCAPLSVSSTATGIASCIVVVALPPGTGGGTCSSPGAACDPQLGLFGPSSDPNAVYPQSTADAFCAQHEQTGASPAITPAQPVCGLAQVIIDPANMRGCTGTTMPGWCLVQGAAAQALGCSQAIEFALGSPPAGTTATLVCP